MNDELVLIMIVSCWLGTLFLLDGKEKKMFVFYNSIVEIKNDYNVKITGNIYISLRSSLAQEKMLHPSS
jgi:hypothetical protein